MKFITSSTAPGHEVHYVSHKREVNVGLILKKKAIQRAKN